MNTLQTGTDVSSISDINDMLESCGMNWGIELSPVKYGKFGQHVASGVYGAYRDDTQEFIDVYRTRNVVSNQDTLALFDTMLKAYNPDIRINRVGDLGNWKNLYISADLPITLAPKLNKHDITKVSIIMTNSHLCGVGGSISLYYERLVCTNGMTKPVKSSIGISHSSTFSKNCLNSFNGVIELINNQQRILDVLSEHKLPVHVAEDIIIDIFGKKIEDEDESEDIVQPQAVTDILSMYQDAGFIGSELVQKNSAYALLNCATEYFSHHQSLKNEHNRFANIVGVQPSQKWMRSMLKLENALVTQAVKG